MAQQYSHNTSFSDILETQTDSESLKNVIEHITKSIKYIHFAVQSGHTLDFTQENASGDTQIPLDIIADTIVTEELKSSGYCHLIASEEQETTQTLPTKETQKSYAVGYDPLDGSSIVDVNFSIGSVFGIWDTDSFEGKTGNALKVSIYAIYGPQVLCIIAFENSDVFLFQLNEIGEFVYKKTLNNIDKKAKQFAPGNLKIASTHKRYNQYIQQCIESHTRLRYSGGMVPDIHAILMKSNGLFSYPTCTKTDPEGKLRLLFECMPLASIVERCGGKALNQKGKRILDIPIQNIHQKTSLFIGSSSSVNTLITHINTN